LGWLRFFETLCLWYLPQIKVQLGIAGVSTEGYAWHSKTSRSGVQIALLINRKEGIINLCEIKNTAAPVVISESFAGEPDAKNAGYRTKRVGKSVPI
jgi:hypothetical protein